MTEHPTYLDALARAAGWERPTDDRTDAALPRPRSRFEPDGPDLASGEVAYTETAVEAEASGSVAEPTHPRAQEDAPVQPTEDEPPVRRPEPTTATTEPAAPPPEEAPQRLAAQPAAEEVAARKPARPLAHVEPAEPAGLPSPPVRDIREPPPAEPVMSYPEPEPAAQQRESHPTTTAAVPVDRSDPAPPGEPTPAPEVAHEARSVSRPVELAATEEPVPLGPEAEGEPTVVVEIGRIEVRLASDPGTAPRPTAIRPTPGPSLADYLRDRSAGEGRPA